MKWLKNCMGKRIEGLSEGIFHFHTLLLFLNSFTSGVIS
jgi:hypothetical protein